MNSSSSFRVAHLGSLHTAQNIAERAFEEVAGYRAFLDSSGFRGVPPWQEVPVTDKNGYVNPKEFKDLLAENLADCFCLFASSGSSGGYSYWPLLRESYRGAVAATERLLESHFAIHKQKTLFIVLNEMNAWMGGEHLCWSLKNAAFHSEHPIAVFPAGQWIADALNIIKTTEDLYDQFVLVTVPSLIGHFHLLAEKEHVELPFSKIKYLVSGEPTPESMRTDLRRKAGVEPGQPFMYSVYASAETGALGVESVASIAARELLTRNEGLAEELELSGPIPHLFHGVDADSYLELHGGALTVTRWQAIPLVRYCLHDAAELFAWEPFRKAILGSSALQAEDEPLLKVIRAADRVVPDLIAISGRSDACVILGGGNIFEYELDAAVRAPELSEIVTGAYKARVVYQGEHQLQKLEFELELKEHAPLTQETEDFLYTNLCKTLCRSSYEFLEQYKYHYRTHDHDRASRIFCFDLCHWPSLSEKVQESHKHRGLADFPDFRRP